MKSKLVVLSVAIGLAGSSAAHAQCCSGYSAATVCNGAGLTRSRWCIQDTVPGGQNALPAEFCAYGDKVVTTLETVFGTKAKDVFEFELDSQTGGAHTGTSCGHLGDGVAYDAFKGSAYGATGFWGYLLALHEAINDWTGMSSGGWPTDFWADHQSAFPNLMDFHIMNTIGMANDDQNLIKAAAAQKKRWYPGGDSADPKVVALDNVYAAMPNGDGYAGFAKMFAMVSGDGLKWDGLGVPNPDVKRSEYVVAYMSLATRKNVLTLLQGPGPSGGGNICNGTPDGTASDKPYTCDSAHIDTIATAHCSIAANGNPSADLTSLRKGSYTNIASGPCGAKCPAECACDAMNHCVPSWLGMPSGTGGMGDAGKDDAGSSGGTGAGGVAGAGGTTSSGGRTASNGGTTTTGAGGATSAMGGNGATANGGSNTTTTNGGSTSMSPGGATSGATGSDTTNSGSGCGCRVVPARRDPLVLLVWFGLGALAVGRRRRHDDA